jgi:prepilin-type N-terminal cleavage/methylation domain-containing protein
MSSEDRICCLECRESTRAGRGGFTLAELLVVVAVIAMLLAIVAGATTRGFAIARSIKCKANLRHLGQAVEARRAEVNLQGRDVMEATGWGDAIKEHVGHNQNAFVCAEANTAEMTYPDIKIEVWRPNAHYYDLDTFTAYPYWDECAASEMDFAPGIWKLNAEDFASLNPQEGVSIAHMLPRYTPGKNPNEYYYVFEDQRSGDGSVGTGDVDYDDIGFHVIEDRSKAELTIRTIKGGTWFTFNLVGPREGEFYTDVGDGGGPFPFSLLYMSYGMNWEVERFGTKTDKILMLDYGKEVVEVSGGRSSDAWDQEVKPRHLGKVNVLMGDMSVISMDPDEIDPGIIANEKKYWTP